MLYQAGTDFGRVDIYRGLARALGLEPSYRRAQLWRDIKLRVQLKPVVERERFAALIEHALKSAGCQNTLVSTSGMEILR